MSIYKPNPSKKVLFLLFTLVIMCLLAIGIYAVFISNPVFYDGTTEQNITIYASIYPTITYIDIPMYAYSNNITIYAQGVPFVPVNTPPVHYWIFS